MDAWLGADTGLLKGVSVSRKQAVNFSSSSRLSREREVRVLSWAGPGETELLVGSVDGLVRTFSAEKGTFTSSRRCGEPREGCFSGLHALGSAMVTCTEKGTVRVWKEDSDEHVTEVRAGEHVHRMRPSPSDPHKVATGGKENPLKIWDLQNPDKPVFSAKNLRDNWLDLRQPHWVKDMAFIPETDKVVTCTGHHQVHVFDPSTPRRRPVLQAVFGDVPLTALSLPADGNTVVVANTQGQVALLDLRMGLLVCGALKGATGSVRALQCHQSLPLVASCGLDRFLRIHSLRDRKLQHKVYLKSRLNCLLFSSRDPNADAQPVKVKEEEDEEEDEVWDGMERVHEAGERYEETGETEEGEEEEGGNAKEEEGGNAKEEEEGNAKENKEGNAKENKSINEEEGRNAKVVVEAWSADKEEESAKEEAKSAGEEEKVTETTVKTKRKADVKKEQKKKKRKKD
ncbi:WD repeat-containing protein 74-like [Eucyclogobius newberryi]|uniref:WD repeat-containing protein 74-like n=1 Tax=Eucyclogobius newberryi TaxID=166745 RepID=UPI003B5B4041